MLDKVMRSTDSLANDHSATFHELRGSLKDRSGRSYLNFIKTLRPDYKCVKRDLAFGYCFLISSVLAIALFSYVSSVLAIVFGAPLIGFWTAYIMLFIHEGAHYNLTASKETNDRLCDIFIGWIIGTSVANYRIVHFKHHSRLGKTDDSEATYFYPLDLKFIVSLLFGIRALDVLISRRKLVTGMEPKRNAGSRKSYKMPVVALLMHGICMLFLWLLGGVAPFFAWLIGIAIFFPFFGALRQLLEHRRDDVSNDIDFFQTDHGAMTRLFEDGPFARIFGGAGFNRHLLHHWEPQLSYTVLPRLEEFLTDTQLAGILSARRTTYFKAIIRLIILPSFNKFQTVRR